ncbi:matrix remodeling associated 5 [Ictidomys tridecemlineatus]|uniref:matrix-remodeling-associated protein 5 n=1 Tax=Ictidomys tridecemlineatus TaxID=43179 RepID=UPI00025DAA9C|nr:matrix-remodeling-associated protein 5 [Ictidomys tridecemlineatus]KAG3284232.1 matrix remodeling associated 5 [Ictidomys tridecemlineatus]
MLTQAQWGALSVVLMVAWGQPPAARACPHPCSCYVPSEVHCTFRSLPAVPAGISKHVERINLGFNSIQALSETSFAGLTKLELLMMHGNNIPSIPDGALRDLSALQVFKFSYNKVRVITRHTLQGLSSLMRLHMDHNRIEFVHPQAFQGLLSLRLLHLEGNLLHQLHPDTFCTFTLLDHFRLSTVRHLYLADNALRALPDGMLQNMPLLENLYLHGNPWACGCGMAWLLGWGARSRGVLKCKKDKAYEGGQLCATCSSPRKLQKQEILKVTDMACLKPSIESPLRHNRSRLEEEEVEEDQEEEEQDQEEAGDSPRAPREGFGSPRWNISLNMTDEHRNMVLLLCDIKKPRDLSSVQLNQTDPPEMDVNATLALDLECPMTRDNYEKLWKLIAYYSEVPVKLHREATLSQDPGVSYQYRQDADADALYYTGVRAQILAEPEWVMQPSIEIQLNRRQSTARKVLLSYQAQYSQTVSPKDTRNARGRSWVMIERDGATPSAHTVLEGGQCQLSCNVKASESPSISWVLPDGSVLKAPTGDQVSRFSVLGGGQLRIQSMAPSDSGSYRCVAQVRDDVAQVAYKVLVMSAPHPPLDRDTVTIEKDPGESAILPCSTSAIPEAHVTWILPDRRLVSAAANTSHAHLLPNGSLSIPQLQVGDGGYYRCVAVNQKGADHYTVGIAVQKSGPGRSSKRVRRPGAKGSSRVRGDVVEDEGGSGTGQDDDPSRRVPHPKDQQVVMRSTDEAPPGDKIKKGRRKMKLWKHPQKEPEASVAEGRRVFESRRRVNMEKKQINPERWADILARVRGKNVPRGTRGPQLPETATSPSASPEATSLSPAVSPPPAPPARTVPADEGSSGDASLLGEDGQVSSTLSPTGTTLDDVVLGEPRVTGARLEEEVEDELTEGSEDVAPTGVDARWVLATTRRSEPLDSSPAQWTSDTVYEEPTDEERVTETWSAAVDATSMPEGTTEDEETPLETISLAESETVRFHHQDLEPNSEPGEDRTSVHFPPMPTAWVGATSPSGSLGAPDDPALSPLQGPTDNSHLEKSSLSTQRPPLHKEDMAESSRADPSASRPAKGPDIRPTLTTTSHIPPWAQPGESTTGARPHQGPPVAARTTSSPKATSPSAPATATSRRRPGGRRRSRPNKLRHRHKQTPATALPPTGTSTTPPTQVPEMKTASQVDSHLVPTSWVDTTVNVPKRLDPEKHPELGSKGSPRRKNGKRPNKHRSTESPTASVSKPSPSPEDEPKQALPPSLETTLLPRIVPLRTGDPHAVTGVTHGLTTTTKIPSSQVTVQGTTGVTHNPESDGKETANDRVTKVNDRDETDTSVPGASSASVSPTSVSWASTGGNLKEESPPLGIPQAPTWSPPRTDQPRTLQTDILVTNLGEGLTDPPSLRELGEVGSTSEVSPSAPVSTPFRLEGLGVPTPVSDLPVEWSSSQAGTTTRGQHEGETTVVPGSSETGPQSPISSPARLEEVASTPPPTTSTSLGQAATTPVLLTLGTSPAPAGNKGHFFSNSADTPETKDPLGSNEGTQLQGMPSELSPPSSHQDGLQASPRQQLGKEAFDGSHRNSLLRAPDTQGQDGRLHISQPPAREPARPPLPRGTARPPEMATQSSLRYLATVPPSRHSTRKPEATAFPSRLFPENKLFTAPKSATTTMTTTARVPLHLPKPAIPGAPRTDQRMDRLNGDNKLFGSNSIPESRHPAGELPKSRVPPYSMGRFPFFINRTPSFPQLGVTVKPQTSPTPASVTRDNKMNPGLYHRVHSQGTIHVDFGPPAPPLRPPRTTAPPSTRLHNVPLIYSTRSSVPAVTSPAQSPVTFHHSTSKILAGGPSTSKFWVLGEKPQIVTKSPQTVSVTAETDFAFPCEATGKPKPFITWTKVSTGALMTPNTRIQRFEVLANGTLVIRRVQTQDRGQYLCTASNLHGVDKMVVALAVTVQQPQILASRYQDVTVYLGDTIAMECLAKGTPLPQISWIFPDRRVWHAVSPVEGRITLHENRTLSIKDASFSDRGVYKCVASNAAGADSLAIRLHVAALPPVIHQDKAENISLPPGLSIHIHCSARAAPPPTVRWLLSDGSQVRPSQFVRGNLFVFPNGTLYIRNLAPKDSGRYECVAANLVGTARRTVQLTVQRAAANARITGTSPRRTDIRYGGTLRLDCSASGDPWPRILWRLPSKRMIDALFSFDSRVKVFANGTLVVKSVTDKDAGDYLCVARNKVGDDYVVLQVNVEMKPAKIEHKEGNDHRVLYGGDLKVDCVATGLPNPEISWSLPDGSLVHSLMQADDSGARTKRYVVFHNGTLYFNEVGPREEGDYTCVAENQVGKDEMRVRVQVVAEPAAIRNKTHSVVQVPYGEVATVPCQAKGEPVPKVTWFSPAHRPIPASSSSDKYEVSDDGTLLIHKAQRSDSGNYTCLVRNSAGEDRKTVWVQVHVEPPRINGHPSALTTVREVATAGSRKLLDCQAQGIPSPRVLWAFPEGVILPAPYYGNRVTVHRNGSLDITRVRKTDSVQLVCIARNEGGEARLMVQLTVLEPLEKPVFHDPVSEKITAMAGHTISLNCSASGTPPPTLLWVLPNGTELPSGRQLQRFYHKRDGMLHVSGLSPVDAGAYRCVARNAAGHSERLVSLKVGLKPEPSRQYHNLVSIINGENLRLSCAPPGSSRGRFSWTLPNGMALDGPQDLGRVSVSENGSLTVREASVFDRGTYVCRVETPYGSLVVSTPVIVIAYPPRITSEPVPVVYTRPGNTVKMNCLAMGIPKAEITWELPDKSQLTAGAQARLYGNRYLHPQGSLSIQHATQRDAGFYKCTARNILGTDSKTTYVHVY